MPKWDQHGGRLATTLFEAAAFHRSVKLACRCGHEAVLDPHALWWRYYQRGWDDRIKAIGAHLTCSACKRRGWMAISLAEDAATDTSLPMPPLHEWKRATNRFRN